MAYTWEHAYDLIASAQERARMAHAYLICGDSGSGKELLAGRIIQLVSGKAAQSGMDLFGEPVKVEVPPLDDLASTWVRILRPQMKSRRISVEDIRELEQSLHLASPEGICKVGVLVEADRLTESAANAFLKTLEEPPRRTILLLLTANPQRLLPTILSRCVRLPLIGGCRLLEQGGAQLVSALNRAAQRGFGTPVAALQLKSVFSAFLSECREAAEAASKAASKEETAAYKDGTDGSWLKSRETFHKAAAEADYLEARNRLFEVLMAWMADLLRLNAGAAGLDFPESSPALLEVARAQTQASLLARVEALEELRRTLETNAYEPLAIEVGFLKAFG